MRRIGSFVLFVGLLALATAANAEIIGAGAWDDGDGALVCDSSVWDVGTYTMRVSGNQYFGPGHIGKENLAISNAYFTTDTELDPTVTIRNTIDNDTGISWTGYHVNVYMDKAFTLSDVKVYDAVSVPPGVTSELGWTGSVTGAVTQISPTEWQGQIDYVGATPIANLGMLDFGYKMSFIGSVHYCQEFIPVPEPTAIALAFVGIVGLLAARRRLGF